MKYISMVVLIIFISSCSSLKKTIIYSSLIGGMTGATTGVALSPNNKSKGANAAVFGLIGAGVAALAGYALYKDDPRNYKLKNMLLDEKKKNVNPNEIDIELGNLRIDATLGKKETYEVPVKRLPKKLQGKVNKQFLIKHQSKERYVKKGSKTFYIPAFEVYEHSYGEMPNAENGGQIEK